jgi:hypothetical protein
MASTSITMIHHCENNPFIEVQLSNLSWPLFAGLGWATATNPTQIGGLFIEIEVALVSTIRISEGMPVAKKQHLCET